MSSHFEVIEHILPCQHIREYSHATASGNDEELEISIKQYIPDDGQLRGIPRKGITIVGAHCNGYSKETYEPLWADLFQELKERGVNVNSIWMADMVNQGFSGVLNEDKIGDEPNWFDHSRDLLHMINHFRTEITRPIIGIGHSMGGAQLIHLSNIHPRLFHSLVLLDPVVSIAPYKADPPLAKVATFRKDVWPSYTQLEKSIHKSKLYTNWDPRALDQLVKYGFRQGPTRAVPSLKEDQLTTITSRHQEAFTIARPNYEDIGVHRKPNPITKLTHPDMYDHDPSKAPFYRAEIRLAYLMLETLRPACLYVTGKKSPYIKEQGLEEKIKMIGTGVGGSGGVQMGRVKRENVNGTHFFPFEAVTETAAVLGPWIQAEVVRSEEEEEIMRARWDGKVGRERQVVDDKWVRNVKDWKGRTMSSKL